MREWKGSNNAAFTGQQRQAIEGISTQLHELTRGGALTSQNRQPSRGGSIVIVSSGVTDHGALTGLTDDDHAQYLLLSGRAAGQKLSSVSGATIPLWIHGAASQTSFFYVDNNSNNAIFQVTSGGININGGSNVEAMGLSQNTISVTNSFTTAVLSLDATVVQLGGAASCPLVVTKTGLGNDSVLCIARSAANRALVVRAHSSATTNLTEWQNSAGTGLSSVGPAGVISAGTSTPATTSPLGAAVLNATGITGAANGLRATAFDSAAAAVHAIGATSSTYALRVALGAANPDAAGIMADGRAGFGALPESNCAMLAQSVAAGGIVTKVRGLAAQSANLTEWQNSASAALASVSAGGLLSATVAGSLGAAVVVGTTTSAAGVLGRIALTAQTGNLAAQTMLTGGAGTAGMYRLSFYIKCTTAGTPAVAQTKVTVAWNDGTAQTVDVPFLSGALAPFVNADLGTLNAFAQGHVVVKAAASQNITFTTTGTYTGSPQYSIDARIEALG